MFKFGKNDKGKEKEAPQGAGNPVFRELSPEEKKKMDNQRVDRDSMIAALKGIGKTDEEIERMFPKALSEAEQKEKVLEIKALYDARNFAEVVSTGVALYERDAFTGNNKLVVGWMIGIAAIVSNNQVYTKAFAEHAVLGYINFVGYKDETGATSTISMMEMGDKVVPGCMHSTALKIFSLFRDYYGDAHDYTMRIKKYL